MTNDCLPTSYCKRATPDYFVDNTTVTFQPDVYRLAVHLAARASVGHIVDLGCGRALKLAPHAEQFHIVGLDYGANIKWAQQHHEWGTWHDFNLNSDDRLPIDDDVLADSVVICADVIEHMPAPGRLLAHIKQALEYAPYAVLSTPDRDRIVAEQPPRNTHHVQEWAHDELLCLLNEHDLPVLADGHTINNNRDRVYSTSLVVLSASDVPYTGNVPQAFSVQALMCVYNEADILESSLQRLVAQGIQVHVIDNWSSDGSYEIARRTNGVTVERYPPKGRGGVYAWQPLLERCEQVANESDADWCLLHDADEIRTAPFTCLNLRQALYHVQQQGYNVINHTLFDLHPLDNTFAEGDFGKHFTHGAFGTAAGHTQQFKAWRNDEVTAFAWSGGHQVRRESLRVYPLNFLTQHYRFRSEAHATRKLQDRLAVPGERASGWHTHYDTYREASVLREASDLITLADVWDYVCERLTGAV